MTLQYRIRSKYEDQRWRQRIYLSDRLLSEAIDQWCRSDAEFPVRGVVARAVRCFKLGKIGAVLFALSPETLVNLLAQFETSNCPGVVAGILYLFSPRCEPLELSPYRLCEWLGRIVGTPEEEYQLAWPRRAESQGHALIASLSAIIAGAVKLWGDHGVGNPSSGVLAEQLAEEIVAQKYVIFHHCQTTRRDLNHWGI